MVKAILLSQISRYKRNWTEMAVCLTAWGINEGSPGAGTNRDAAPGASANWRGVIVPQTVPERTGILFKYSVAVAAGKDDGQRARCATGAKMICCFTDT